MSRDRGSTTGSGSEKRLGKSTHQNKANRSIRYEIRIQGELSNQWFDCFEGLSFQILEKDQTLILATLTDKSALHGLLTRIGELNLTVLSVNKVEEIISTNDI